MAILGLTGRAEAVNINRMTLKYDTSGMKYVTQEAYGTTWELQSTDTDGCQVWRNAAGQQAVVPRVAAVKPVCIQKLFCGEGTEAIEEKVMSIVRGTADDLFGSDDFTITSDYSLRFDCPEPKAPPGTWTDMEPNGYNNEPVGHARIFVHDEITTYTDPWDLLKDIKLQGLCWPELVNIDHKTDLLVDSWLHGSWDDLAEDWEDES